MRKIWKFIKWPVYALIIFFTLTGLKLTYRNPRALSYYWWEPIKNVFVEPASVVNNPAPDFTLKNLEDVEVTLSVFHSQPVLVVFWDYLCGYCVDELPMLIEFYKQYKDQGLEVLAISCWSKKWAVEGFIKNELQIPFTVLYGEGTEIEKIKKLYGVDGIPHVFYIDKNGIVKHSVGGYDSTKKEEYRKLIKELF